ncbi:MAG: prepilin-type N-terminal cleavage/methylation domain-containing protein [Actinobacteria bacterium]|nr:prepilin-type N-terminal cleavage/methylation domain-containing protein [Actinomycetota bacterium]
MAEKRRARTSRLRAWAGEGGFTLVEVLAAVFIFAVISTATFTIIITALKTVHQNNERVLTANVARSQVEYLRLLGAAGITPGLSTTAPPGTRSDFIVETSAQWVGLGQTASACDAATPGQAYVRVHVEVTSPDVDGSSSIDTVIAPDAAASTSGTAAAAISVKDQNGDPVSGVTITAVDTAHPTNSFIHITGDDGCLFIPQLTAPSSLHVTISKSGYVSSSPTGTTATVPLDQDSLAKPSFQYAAAAGIAFAGSLADFPLVAGMPVQWQVSETGATLHTGAVGTTVAGQWPTLSGFAAWPGDCADADPQVYASARQAFDFIPGDQVAAALTVRPVKLRGLPADTPVTVKHKGGTGCTTTAIPIGRSNANGILRVGLPNGDWTFTALTETQPLVAPLAPPAAGAEEPITVVSFTLANLDASPSPSPSGSPSPSPTP